MIEQVVGAAIGKEGAAPPPELSLLWKCQRFGCLPEAGGYMDQDGYMLDRAALYEDVYTVVKKWRGMGKDKSFDKFGEREKSVFRWLRELEIDF